MPRLLLPSNVSAGVSTEHIAHHAELARVLDVGLPVTPAEEGSLGQRGWHTLLAALYDAVHSQPLPAMTGGIAHAAAHQMLHAWVNGLDERAESGTYRPSPDSTGWRAGQPMQVVDGNITVTSPNTILDGLHVRGRVNVQAPGCRIRRSWLRGAAGFDAVVSATSSACSDLVIEDSVIDPEDPSWYMNGIDGHDFTLRFTEIRGCVDGMGLHNSSAPRVTIDGLADTYLLNVLVDGCWLHDFHYVYPDSHHGDLQPHTDGIQFHGGSKATIIGTLFDMRYLNGVPSHAGPTPDGGRPIMAAYMHNRSVGESGLHFTDRCWFDYSVLPINCGGGSSNLGTIQSSVFDGQSSLPPSSGSLLPETIKRRADQVLDAKVGTSLQNTFPDGTPILVRTNG